MGEAKKEKVPTIADDGFVRRDAETWESEKAVRKTASSGLRGNRFTAPFVNAYAALLVFIFHLISIESLISIGVSVYLTIYCYHKYENDDSVDGSIMSWVLLSFAVITPLSSSIAMAFARRDAGLNHMATIKASLVHIYSAHACWDWSKAGKNGRDPEYDWFNHCEALLEAAIQLSHELSRLLKLPTSSRARHRVTSWGRREAAMSDKLMTQLHLSISDHLWKMTELCEDFKFQGLPPNEATRIRQWERFVSERIEMLIVLKRYRTPQALRSFARLFTVILPPFYAPFYGQMAKDLNSLSLAIAFAVITAIALTSLFESIQQMEDPFVGNLKLDNIDVVREFEKDLKKQLLGRRRRHFKDAPPFRGKGSAFDSMEIPELVPDARVLVYLLYWTQSFTADTDQSCSVHTAGKLSSKEMKMIRFLISSLVLVMSTLIRGQEAELPCASCLDGTVPCDLPCTSSSRTMMWVSIRRFNASLVQDWFTCQCQNGKTGFSPSYHSINTDAEDFTVTSDGGYNEGGARTFTTRNSTDALVGVSCPADTGLYCEIRSSSDLAWPSSGVISHWGPLFCALNDTDSEMRERIISKNGTIDFPAGTETENLLPISVDVARTEGAVQVYRAASQKGYLSHFADLDIDLGGTSFVSGQSCYADCGNDLQDYSAGLGECVPAPPPMPRPDPQVPCEPCELDATCVLPCTSDARSLLWISIRRPNPFWVQDWFTCQCQDGNAAFTPGYNSIHTDVEDIRVTSDGGFNSGGARKFSTRNNDALVGLSCPANTGLYCEIRGWSDLAWPSSGIISNSGPLYCSLDIDSELRERVSNGSLDFPAGPDTENLLPASVATGQTEGMMSLFRAGSQQGYASHFADSDIDVGATSFVSGKNCPVECEAKLKQYAEGMGECFQTPPPMSPSTPSPTRGPTPQQPAPTASPITPNPSNLITANPVPQPTTQQPSSTAIGAIPQPPYQQPTTEPPSIEQPTTAARSVAARSMARGATSLAAITLCTLQVIY